MKRWLIEKLGGYPDIDSAIEAIKQKDLPQKYEILTLAVKKFFNTISSEDILREDEETGHWLCQGKALSRGERDLLIAQATEFQDTLLWRILQLDIKYQANKKMYIESMGEMQIVAGKLWTYTLEAFKTRLQSLRAKSATFNKK